MAQEEDHRASKVTFHPYCYLSVTARVLEVLVLVCCRAKTSLYHVLMAVPGYIYVGVFY